VLKHKQTLVNNMTQQIYMRSKADDGQLNLGHGTETKNKEKLRTKTE